MDSLPSSFLNFYIRNGLLFIFFLLSIKYVALAVYRVYWHPLARYPGPFFAKVSDWYAAYHGYKGNVHKDTLASHRKYGNVVRYGPNRLVFATATSLHDIYESKNVKKSINYKALLPGPNLWNTHDSVDKMASKTKRRFISQWLSKNRLKQLEPMVQRETKIFMNKILEAEVSGDSWTNAINISDDIRFLMFDITTQYCLGHSFHLQTDHQNRYLVHIGNRLHQFNSAYIHSVDLVRYHLEKLFYPHGLWWGFKVAKLFRQFSADEFKHPDTTDENLLSLLYQERNKKTGEKLPSGVILAELKFFLATGSSSPASVLSAALFYLVRNPACYARLVSEIRSTFSDPSEIGSGEKLNSLHYLHAVIKETLRMSPPKGGILWREVEEGGLSIDGEFVNQSYDVGAGIYSVNHNESYYPEPYSFKAERWLRDETTDNFELSSQAFASFSLGPRQCLGREIVTLKLSNIIVLLLWHMDLRRPLGKSGDIGGGERGSVDENEFQQRDHIISFYDGPCIEFRRRVM